MLLFITLVTFFITHSQGEDVLQYTEDQRVVNETISKFGPPRNYQKLQLPGPEIAVDDEKLSLHNSFIFNSTKCYVLRVRNMVQNFSYNARYEETELKVVANDEIVVTKGQFGEHFKRKSGGFYIRSIGYTLDEKGYKEFLIDLTTAVTTVKEVIVDNFGGLPGAPVNKGTISSTVLGTLIGGNAVG